MLDKTDWDILLEYDKDVFQSYHSISKTVGVHHSTVQDRINSMKNRNILRPDKQFIDPARGVQRTTSEVKGAYSPTSLGLERIHVIFNKIGTKSDFQRIYDFCDHHPYTHYLTQLFGFGMAIYAQFDIPKGTFGLHKNTFESLANEYVRLEEIEIYKDEYEARASPNYNRARDFDSTSNENLIDYYWNEFLENRVNDSLLKPEIGKPIDNIDAEIIRELTINGKVKIVDLAEYFGLNKSTLSRRVNKIRANYVTRGILGFGKNAYKVIGFNNTQLVTGSFETNSELNSETFLKFISSNNILPFDAFLTTDNNKFLLYTRASVGITDDILEFLFNKSDPVNLNQYQFYISKSDTYHFYHLNYDEEVGFNTESNYIKDDAIATIFNK